MQFVNGLSLACVETILINAYDIYDQAIATTNTYQICKYSKISSISAI